jgi:AraC family transcriptional regulator of adaptative response/methylated-DNA-[protein]-cysteine methyltransferase
MRIEWTSLPYPIGHLVLVESEGRPLVVEFALRARRMRWMDRLRERLPTVQIDPGPCRAITGWLDAYFQRRPRRFSYPAYLSEFFAVSTHEEVVWRALCDIPLGETRSYEQIAQATGLNPRVVGQLNGANHLAILIPCHRVVGKDGSLVGYGGGVQKKRWLLDHEIRMQGVVLS